VNQDNSSHQPIGLFDSGFGGLTVMREVVRLLPQENLIYLGDTARLPYGNKSPQTVLEYALENASFLLEKKIKLLMIPCHTACSHAFDTLQDRLSIPVIGVVQPGLELLLEKTLSNRVAILATPSTIGSELYQNLIRAKRPHIEVHSVACPLFVPLVEEGFYNHPSAALIAEAYLSPLFKKGIDAALLACTHYPLMRSVIQQVLGPKVQLIEPAESCAFQAKNYLALHHQLNMQNNKPSYEFYVSDDPEKFRRLGKIFFGTEIQNVTKKNSAI